MSYFSPKPKQKPKRLPRRRPIKAVPSLLGDKNIVGNWLFYIGAGDVLHDFSDYNNDGELNGDPQWNDERSASWTLYFDGDDYVLIEHSDELCFSTEDFTVMFWLYFVRRTDGFAAFLQKQDWGTSGWATESETAGDPFAFTNGEAQEKYFMDTVSDDLEDVWSHLAFVRDGGDFTWYLNGAVDNTGTVSDWTEGTVDLKIMGEPGVPRYIEGHMGEVHIFSGRALSGDEVNSHYERTKPLYGL